MALADPGADADEDDDQKLSCSLDNITSCPSARILKVLLKRINTSMQLTGSKIENVSNESENQQQREFPQSILQSLKSVMEKYEYSATKLLDDLHHLQYEHRLNEDDAKFDEAFVFINESTPDNECNVNQCPFVNRHYRVRGRGKGDYHEANDNVLMDVMAQIHCYFVHSFDIEHGQSDQSE